MTTTGYPKQDELLLQLATNKLVNISTKWRHDDKLKRDTEILSTTLAGYAPASLLEIISVTNTAGLMFLADSILSHGESEEFIRDLIAFMPYIIDSEELGFPGKRNLYLRGIAHYGHIEPQGMGRYPARRLAQGSAILRVTAYFKAHGVKNKGVQPSGEQKNYAIIMDSGIRTLLTTSDNPEALADLIIERNLNTYDKIRSFSSTTNDLEAPLREGAL